MNKAIHQKGEGEPLRPLSELSLEELWELFPIRLERHQACWKEWYQKEEALLRQTLLPYQAVRISHIGSTAVPGIWAKPIVDILVEITRAYDFGMIQNKLSAAGYLCLAQSGERMSCNTGYTPNGFASQVFHLHLRREGDHDELYFRDYLRTHPDDAAAYERLKLSLWKQYEHDRDGYTEAKTAFVEAYTRKAKWIKQGLLLNCSIIGER